MARDENAPRDVLVSVQLPAKKKDCQALHGDVNLGKNQSFYEFEFGLAAQSSCYRHGMGR